MKLINALLTSVTLSFSVSSFASIDRICPDAPSASALVEKKLSESKEIFGSEQRHTFFVGLWTILEPSERYSLAMALHKTDASEMTHAVQKAVRTLAQRLSGHRQKLVEWVQQNEFQDQLEVLEIPKDGSFVLVKATEPGLRHLLCAAAEGALPEVFLRLSP